MYLGKLCEIGNTTEVFNPPYHPYTEALFSSVALANPDIQQKTIRLEGSVPSPKNPPSGCRFHTRCAYKMGKICEEKEPSAFILPMGGMIYCHKSVEDLPKDPFYTLTADGAS